MQAGYHCAPVLFLYLTGGEPRTSEDAQLTRQDRGVEQRRSPADRHTPNRCSGNAAPPAQPAF
jgi:hypothetical protein